MWSLILSVELEMTAKLESDLRSIVHLVVSGLLISMPEKLNLFHLTSTLTLVLLMWKWLRMFLRKNHLLRYRDGLSLLNWIWALRLSEFLKLPPRKLELWFALWKFVLRRLLLSLQVCHTVLYGICHVWAGPPSCYLELLGHKNRYVVLLVFHLLPLLNRRLIVEM